ncbi:MAG: NusA-like transcription termination signal-binding factor [Candidatus Aenigmarchaeota archaeon]|nr:NusA-like transcription termination signal-binding factor [Candidatus Aenigmarchaeota archaeon]
MKVTLDMNTIQTINLFHNITGSNVVDCVDTEDMLYFVVQKGEYGLAVGKNGAKIKIVEKKLRKTVKIFEYSEDLETFIKNIVPEAQETTFNEKKILVRLKPADRAKVIGKAGKNIKIINVFLKRLFDIEEMKVK